MTTPASDLPNLPRAPEVFQMEVGLLQNFCEILSCPETKEAAIVDPAWEVDRLLVEARRLGVKITKMLITHGHNDHVEGIPALVEATGATVVVNAGELDRVKRELGDLGATLELVGDRQDVAIGKRGVRALFTPGHTAGGTCFLADGYLISGDVLFVGGCGRTDFPGGDTTLMWHSLRRLGALPEETRLYPGHDYGSTLTSTIGRELLENPYLRCETLDAFKALRDRGRRG